MDVTDFIANGEVLYRRVPNAPGLYSTLPNGDLRLSSTAFNDRGEKPSVDRAILRLSPEETKHEVKDGVVTLGASEIRSIVNIADTEAIDGEPLDYAIDVLYRPILAGNPEGDAENLAHAQIEAAPAFKASSRFKKLKEALAVMASKHGWLVSPS